MPPLDDDDDDDGAASPTPGEFPDDSADDDDDDDAPDFLDLEEQLGLVGKHAYGVLALAEVGDERLVLLKNPWSHRHWSGYLSQRSDWTQRMLDGVKHLYDPPWTKSGRLVDNGVFWMQWDAVRVCCQVMFLSWNPDIFAHHAKCLCVWRDSFGVASYLAAAHEGHRALTTFLAYSPQFRLELTIPSASAAAVGGGAAAAAAAAGAAGESAAPADAASLSAAASAASKKSKPASLLSKLKQRKGRMRTASSGSVGDDPAAAAGGSPVARSPAAADALHGGGDADAAAAAAAAGALDADEIETDAQDVWILLVKHSNHSHAGAAASSPSGAGSPSESAASAAAAAAAAAAQELITVYVYEGVKSLGGRVYSVARSDVKEDIPAEQHDGLCRYLGYFINSQHYLARVRLPPGKHELTVVCSVIRQSHDFAFSVFAFSQLQARKFEQIAPFADRMHHMVAGEWDPKKGTSGGPNTTSEVYVYNPQYRLTVPKGSKVDVVAVLVAPDCLNPIGLHIFRLMPGAPALGSPSSRHCVSDSRFWSYQATHTASEARGLSAGDYVLVPSTIAPVRASFQLHVHLSSRQLHKFPATGLPRVDETYLRAGA